MTMYGDLTRHLAQARYDDAAHGVAPHRPQRAGLRDRFAARWLARSLDRKLARGIAPESQPALTLRAEKLVAPPVRAELARRVQRVVRDAGAAPARIARVSTRREEVIAAAPELDAPLRA
jgi:hypothetical protein